MYLNTILLRVTCRREHYKLEIQHRKFFHFFDLTKWGMNPKKDTCL